MANDKIRFWPFRGTYEQIMRQPYYDGKIYFAYDTNQIILDVNNSKHIMGGGGGGASGSGIIYANGSEEQIIKKFPDNDEDFNYTMAMAALENPAVEPPVDGLILNSDGRFFRVLSVNSENHTLEVLLLAVSGSGGGGPVEQDLFLDYDGIDLLGSTYIYGQSNVITFTPSSTADSYVSFLLTAKDLDGVYDDVVRQTRLYNGDVYEFNTNLLPKSDNIEITVLINSPMAKYNRGKGLTQTFSPIRVLDMYIEKPADITMDIKQTDPALPYIPYFEGLGGASAPVKVNYSIDGAEAGASVTLSSANSKHLQQLDIPMQPHGMHTIRLWLSTVINDQEYRSSEIAYEVPFVEAGNEMPIIWVKNELGTITNYEPAVIQYMVYSAVAEAEGSAVEVSLYRNNDLLNTEEHHYSSGSWLSMDLTPYYEFIEDGVKQNTFSLVCGSATKTINFEIDDRGARDLSLKYPNRLRLNYDSIGRSNKEIRANRTKWVSKVNNYEAELKNFNWYTNGWMNDNDGMGSYLSVANGASVTFPLPLADKENAMAMNTDASPWTFEIRFRIRNAKKFATLVTEIPKYRYIITLENGTEVESELGQEKTLEEINAMSNARPMLDSDGNMVMNEANTTKKIVQTKKYIAMKFLNSRDEGFAIGTQEAYFNTSGSTVNVKYKENEIINISFVVDHAKDALSIYLNGILSGVGSLSAIAAISMENTVKFEINSDYCDFDLYKFRAYPVALTMPDIIHNYIADIKDIDIYDENQLTDVNDATALSYQKLLDYNASHPDDPTMPYAVIDMTATAQGTGLPYAKGNKRQVRIEFTNPVADYLLSQPSDKGGISSLRYYTHCPSFTADNVELDVQGTSSQKYPRRNFKAKFKKAKNWVYTKGELAGKPVFGNPIKDGDETKYENYTLENGDVLTTDWHVDHGTIGSKTFTWKIDYMESSGSYNTGFVNLMGTGIYDKHPLEDLGISGINPDDYRVNVYGFPMLVFHKTGENEYTYIGRYNMNLDKSSNERYGFELKKPHPYVVDPETGKHPNIKDVAECWELRDNQGTWCSFRFPNAEARYNGFRTLMAGSNATNPRYEVAQHFEARYHTNADQFEYAQNIILGKSNDKDYSADIGGNTLTAACNYAYNKLSHLESLFKWLDSTDVSALPLDPAHYVPLDEPVRLLVSGKITKKIKNPAFNYDEFILNPDDYPEPEFIYVPDEEEIAKQAVTYETETSGDVERTYGIFTKNSKEYRRQKFYAEFDKHLDLDYCCTYFVMTELMLCYDSRGKNMMIASWGPREEGGDYIWYPIFYDVDTQLGLNNVGAKLWDYDENNTENGTYSTKDSVLWTNLYDVFYNKVLEKYVSLRKTKIDETTIEDAYMCRGGKTFDSYAMMGKRPIIAIGLDEYYKYVLPVTQEWINQEGNPTTANYLYACQGDRILSRELLIENRLLYMDSKWGGGAFSINTGGMAGANFRSTGNKPSTSSDFYLNGKRWDKATGAYVDDPSIVYPVKYYDATPEYKVTPYLNFFVTTFVDENTFRCEEAYNEAKYPDGIPTVISPSVAEGYKSGQVDQQLNYFAGSKYISSFGDLSTKYMNEIHFANTERLLDITLGSDAPGFYNAETLHPLELYTEVNKDGSVKAGHEKPLLQKINLTNMRGVDTYLDIRSPQKLEEFRALGTQLRYALFAEGAPLNTVHLPNTITRLVLTQNKELKKIITSRQAPVVADMVDGELVYRPHEEYEGLFVDGLTNYNAAIDGKGIDSPISEISFDGDALGYGSYIILKNLVDRKNGAGRTSRLSIRMTDVNWTPYVQVEYGESKIVGTPYYYLTDHSTFEPYDHDDALWYEDTLNGRVYTYNSNMDESTIQDMSLFKLFYDDKNNTPSNEINQFTNNIESMLNQQTYPTISGEVFISNAEGEAIKESDLTDKYGKAFPNLKIRVAKVDPAYIAKFIQVLQSGKEEEIEVIRYPREEGAAATVTQKVPFKQYCDFLGWATTKNPTKESDWFVKYNYTEEHYEPIQNVQEFSEERNVITFYAIFRETPYIVSFKNPDGTVVATTTSTYGQPAKKPSLVPSVDESGLQLTETYKFKGFSKERVPLDANDRVINQSLVNLNNIYVTHDMDLWVVYRKQDVHEEATDINYFVFQKYSYNESRIDGNKFLPAYIDTATYNVSDGVMIEIKPGVKLSGKITLPSYSPDGKPVIAVGHTFSSDEYASQGYAWPTGSLGGGDITHIFWYQTEEKPCQVRMLYDYAFAGSSSIHSKLKYYEFTEGFRYVGPYAFFRCYSLDASLFEFNDNLLVINNVAFQDAFDASIGATVLKIPASVCAIGQYAFIGLNTSIGRIQFGNGEQGSRLTVLMDSNFVEGYAPADYVFQGSAIPGSLEFYGISETQVNSFQALIDNGNVAVTLLYQIPLANRRFSLAANHQ